MIAKRIQGNHVVVNNSSGVCYYRYAQVFEGFVVCRYVFVVQQTVVQQLEYVMIVYLELGIQVVRFVLLLS